MTDTESSGPTGPPEPVGEPGPTGPTGTTGPMSLLDLMSLTGGTAAPPRILLSDLLSDVSVIQQQEATDRAALDAIRGPNLQDIRTKLTTWVAGGFQGSCALVRIPMSAPNACSDGVVRNVYEYIQFLSGSTVNELVASFQQILPDFEIAYQWSRNELAILVVSLKA